MSQTPFNPYSASTSYTPYAAPPQSPLGNQFKILGIFFIILAAIGFLGAIFVSISNVIQLSQGEPKPPPNMEPAAASGYYLGFYATIIGFGLSVFLQPLILWAGINMLRLKGRGMILIGAIVAVIPVFSSCCLLGIPFGIWALVLLSRSDSKKLIS